MAVGAGGRHTDVVEHAEIEQEGRIALGQPLDPPAFGGHDADPLAVGHIVHAHQIEGIRQGVDDVAKIGVDTHWDHPGVW